MRKIITILQKEEWKKYVGNALQYDFYHTWYYHSLDTNGAPILFVYQQDESYIAFPLISRKIPATALSDLSSVYGYTGPVSNRNFEDLGDIFMDQFKASFLNFLRSEKYISIFSRLHPFFNQHLLLDKFGGVHANGKTVTIDLTIPIEDQRKKYHKRLSEKIRQLRRKGYEVKEGSGPEDLKTFASIYTENMMRIGASDAYLFTESYFTDLCNADEFQSKLLFVYKDDLAVCGTIIICSNDIIQAHLLGTRTAYLTDSPAKLLTDEITVIGRQMQAKYFHLGGGLNFKEDSLFEWKASFSDFTLNFSSWRYIADVTQYDFLTATARIDKTAGIDFFPLYRYANEITKKLQFCLFLYLAEQIFLCSI